jgi:4-amino-4-deoxy-L-arabinose transferase-like glycosyltransferase
MTRGAAAAFPRTGNRNLVTAAWLVATTLFLLWILGTSAGTLREQLKVWQFWSLEGSLSIAVLAALLTVRDVTDMCTASDVRRMAAIAAVAVGLTVGVAPRTNRIYYDEQIYQSIGQSLSDLRTAQLCNDGNVEYGRLQCASGEYNKQPYAYPHLLSVAYRLFGVKAWVAFGLNAFAAAATVCALYVLVLLLFEDRDAALFGALLMALTPEQLLWSATAAVEPSASLALVLALVAAAAFRRAGSVTSLVTVVATASYATQFRAESILILPVIGLLVWPRVRAMRHEIRLEWVGLLGFVLIAVHLAHLYAVRNVGWGTADARFSLQYVMPNLRVNGWFYLFDERFPLIYTLLAAIGLARWRHQPVRLLIAFYFFLYFAIDLVFYAGSYNYGADVRYSLMTYPPLAVLGGLGAAWIVRTMARAGPFVPVRALALAAISAQFLWYAPVVRATTEEAWAARADVAFAHAFVPDLPPNSYVVTQNPGMFHVWGVNAGQMFQILANPSYVGLLERRYTGGVYVHWNFWCNVQDPVQPELCRKAMAMRPVEMVREHRERDQRFALYRLERGSP